ncbi:unnamed protein product [Calypogeia fissa]
MARNRSSDLKTLVALIEKGVATKEMRLMVHVMRHTMAIRRQLTASTLTTFLLSALHMGSDPYRSYCLI